MKTARLHLARIVFRFLPETRVFAFKAALLRWCGAKIGSGARVCSSVTVIGCGELVVGEDTWIGHQTFIAANSVVKIGSCVDIGPQVYIGTGTHELDPTGPRIAGRGQNLDIEIGDGVWLGARSLILPGVGINLSLPWTAAGAVVTRTCPTAYSSAAFQHGRSK